MAFPNPLVECFQFREVLLNIISQDLKVKYRRTVLGYVWSLLNPVLQLAVMSAVFSHLIGRFGVENYSQFLFAALIPWIFFQQALSMSAISLLQNENFIKKVYLPKALFPLSKLCLRSVDFVLSLVALGGIGWFLGFTYHLSMLGLPLAVVSLFLFTLGIAVFVSIFTVYFRDVEYFLSLGLQLLYFLTPILYPVTALPDRYRGWVSLNPLYHQITLFREMIYFGNFPTIEQWGLALGGASLSLMVGWVALSCFERDLVYQM